MAGLLAGLFGGGSGGGGHGSQEPSPSYSFARLQLLYDRLSQFRESDLERGQGEAVVECVRQITEALIWGERNDTNFFDFFCEKAILADFIRVLGLRKAPKRVKVQLLQSLSILVQNIRRQTSVYYLLSNNHVNRLIETPMDFKDEEILAYYITLLKSLAMRLDHETIRFFFIERPETAFPLYTEAAKFFAHRDQMVRATVRTITLQVYRVEDSAARHFVHRHAAESYFSRLAYHLRDLWLRLDAAAAGAGEEELASVRQENETQQDLLIYLSDVFELGVAELNEVLAGRLLEGVMLPLLAAGVASGGARRAPVAPPPPPASGGSPGGPGAGGPTTPEGPRVLAPAVALFLLRQVFDSFQSQVLLEPLASALLQPYVPAALAYSLPACLPSGTQPGGHGDLVPNGLRDHFVRCLRSEDDALFLLAAGVVHSCVLNRRALPLAFLEAARILPPRAALDGEDVTSACPLALPAPLAAAAERRGRGAATGGLLPPAPAPMPADSAPGGTAAAESMDVLLLLLHGLRRHALWQLDTMQCLMRIILDIFLDPSACWQPQCQGALLDALRASLRFAAGRLRQFIKDGQRGDDSLLDLIAEEWVLHRAALSNPADVCGEPRRLLLVHPPPPPANQRGGPAVSNCSSEPGAQKTVRSFLLLRRLQAVFLRFVPDIPRERPEGNAPAHPPWSTAVPDEASPLEPPAEVAGSFREGASLEIGGGVDRIVCGVSTGSGKNTRYMLLHEYWFLLVQPDLTSPGWAVVKTLWPIWQIQSLIDRSDPRTLRIGLYAPRGGPQPGEAQASASAPQRPGFAEEPGRSTYYTITLNFEDVRRCHSADQHLQRCRSECRASMLRQAATFVDGYCGAPQAPPSAILEPGEEFDDSEAGGPLASAVTDVEDGLPLPLPPPPPPIIPGSAGAERGRTPSASTAPPPPRASRSATRC